MVAFVAVGVPIEVVVVSVIVVLVGVVVATNVVVFVEYHWKGPHARITRKPAGRLSRGPDQLARRPDRPLCPQTSSPSQPSRTA